MGDYFTKLTELYAMPNMKAETVADIIFKAWIKRYCCPIEIHSDQGRQYESEVFKEMCQLLEINIVGFLRSSQISHWFTYNLTVPRISFQ
jgi:transposase InsO family protein